MKKGFLALTLVASTALGEMLTACSGSNQNTSTAENLPATEAHNKQMEMNGSGGMNHDMMEMDLGPADADYDLRFIDAMILHHQIVCLHCLKTLFRTTSLPDTMLLL